MLVLLACLLERFRFASMWTRPLCLCSREEGKAHWHSKGEGIPLLRSLLRGRLGRSGGLASPMSLSSATGPTSSPCSPKCSWATKRLSWSGTGQLCRQVALLASSAKAVEELFPGQHAILRKTCTSELLAVESSCLLCCVCPVVSACLSHCLSTGFVCSTCLSRCYTWGCPGWLKTQYQHSAQILSVLAVRLFQRKRNRTAAQHFFYFFSSPRAPMPTLHVTPLSPPNQCPNSGLGTGTHFCHRERRNSCRH
jgi:hypothetical protein